MQGFASSPFLKPPPPIKKIQPPLPPPTINKKININSSPLQPNKTTLNNNQKNLNINKKE